VSRPEGPVVAESPAGRTGDGGVPPGTLAVYRLAAACTGLAVAAGALVCATQSGAACPTWPGCYPGRVAPQWELGSLVEFGHRVVAIGAGPLVLAAALLSRRVTGSGPWVRILPWVALAGTVAAGAFGRLVVLSGMPTWMGAIDLFSALTAMTVMGAAAILLGGQRPARSGEATADFPVRVHRDRAAGAMRLAGMSVATVIVLHVTGLFAAGSGSYTRCLGWPLWRLYGGDLHPWLQRGRIGLAAVAAVLIVGTCLTALQVVRLRPLGAAVGVLLGAEMVLGLEVAAPGRSTLSAAAYSVVAVALLSSLGLLTALASASRAVPVPAASEGPAGAGAVGDGRYVAAYERGADLAPNPRA
jgi:cytochrome c oxidase assembly protein subunit 15